MHAPAPEEDLEEAHLAVNIAQTVCVRTDPRRRKPVDSTRSLRAQAGEVVEIASNSTLTTTAGLLTHGESSPERRRQLENLFLQKNFLLKARV